MLVLKKQLFSLVNDLKKEIDDLKLVQNETIKRYSELYFAELEINNELEKKLSKKNDKIKSLEEKLEEAKYERKKE